MSRYLPDGRRPARWHESRDRSPLAYICNRCVLIALGGGRRGFNKRKAADTREDCGPPFILCHALCPTTREDSACILSFVHGSVISVMVSLDPIPASHNLSVYYLSIQLPPPLYISGR